MSPTNRYKYKYFHFTVQRAKDRRQKFHFCRLLFDILHVMSNLISLLTIASALNMKIRSHSSSVGQNFAEAHIPVGKHKWNESQTPHMTGWRWIHLKLKPIATSVKKKVMNSGFIHFCYSDLVPTKLVPWSDRMSLVGPQQLRNRCKASINASVVRALAALRCIAHKAKQANSTHIFSALVDPL